MNPLEGVSGGRNGTEVYLFVAHAGRAVLEQLTSGGQIAVPEIVTARSLRRMGAPGSRRTLTPARKRSQARCYRAHGAARRAYSTAYYWTHRAAVLAQRKRHRRLAWKIDKNLWRPTRGEWEEIGAAYKAMNQPYRVVTFRQLALLLGVSTYAIQRRSCKAGGWAVRAKPVMNLPFNLNQPPRTPVVSLTIRLY